MDIAKLDQADKAVLAGTQNLHRDVELLMWAQDHSIRYSDKVHQFTQGDSVAEMLNLELFDMVLRQALLFGFSVGNAYANSNEAKRLGIIKND